ncbi:hypothetical protein AAG570_006868 [Ranatra chinensis]|uniref:Tetraspanin n=1 Tax=Ranatra chinensis TaxID=642074 RepID=A0ABD0YVB8_9HEMI
MLHIRWFGHRFNGYRKLLGSRLGFWFPGYCYFALLFSSATNTIAWRMRAQFSSKLFLSYDMNHWYFLIILINTVLAHVHFLVSTIVIVLLIGERERASAKLKSSLALYSKDYSTKVLLDRMQVAFECCGRDSYEDWFDFNWYDNTDIKDDLNCDDVPFSCCSFAVHLPCLHHGLNAASENFEVGKGSTLWSKGCLHEFLIPYYGHLFVIGFLVGILSAFEILLSIGDRIVQTADGNRLHELLFVAWIIGESPKDMEGFEHVEPKNYTIVPMPPPKEIEPRKGVLVIRAQPKNEPKREVEEPKVEEPAEERPAILPKKVVIRRSSRASAWPHIEEEDYDDEERRKAQPFLWEHEKDIRALETGRFPKGTWGIPYKPFEITPIQHRPGMVTSTPKKRGQRGSVDMTKGSFTSAEETFHSAFHE